MELRYLRYFVAVAERRSFSRASEDLHVAQSAVSQQIKILETEMGVVLLHRDRRRVELSEAGEAFLVEARGILQKAEQACHLAQRVSRGEEGTLKIGCFSSAVAEFLPGLIRRYRTARPRVEVELREMGPAEQQEALNTGEIHVGFNRRIPAAQAGAVVQERVYSDQVFLVMAESHPLAALKKVPLKAIAQEPFVSFERSGAPEFVDQIRDWCSNAGFIPRVVSEVPLMRVILMYVAAGLGVSLVPGCIRCYRQTGVVFRPVIPRPPGLDLVLARPKAHRNPALDAWLELVRSEFPNIRSQYEGALFPGTKS